MQTMTHSTNRKTESAAGRNGAGARTHYEFPQAPHTRTVLVTPELAAEWLAKNEGNRPLRQPSATGNCGQGKAWPAILGCCVQGGVEDQRVIAQDPGLRHRSLQLSAAARNKHEKLIRASKVYVKRRLKGYSPVFTTPRKPHVLCHPRGMGNLSAGAANSGR